MFCAVPALPASLTSGESSIRLLLLIAVWGVAASVGQAASAAEQAYRVLAQDKGQAAIVNARGEVEWEVECKHNSHDIALLNSGNLLLHTGPATIVEMTPAKKVAWQYDARPRERYNGRVEIHAFQRLAGGITMVAESGNRRIVEVDREGRIVKEIALTVDHPDPHRDTRMARKLHSGNYLVCHEENGVVREYDESGKVVWSYTSSWPVVRRRPATARKDTARQSLARFA
jgi:hypothetical protein